MATAMASLISSLTAIVTGISAMVATWIGVITTSGNEILLFMLLVPFVGIGIGLLKRLLRAN